MQSHLRQRFVTINLLLVVTIALIWCWTAKVGLAQAEWFRPGEVWTAGDRSAGEAVTGFLIFDADGGAQIETLEHRCGGRLVPLEFEVSGGVFRTQLSHGQDWCVDNGTMRLSLTASGVLSAQWTGVHDGQTYATSSLYVPSGGSGLSMRGLPCDTTDYGRTDQASLFFWRFKMIPTLADGEVACWRNVATGGYGIITLTNSRSVRLHPCRDVEERYWFRGMQDEYQYARPACNLGTPERPNWQLRLPS